MSASHARLGADATQIAAALTGAPADDNRRPMVASTSLIDVWIDEAERRSWFLFETTRAPR